MSERYAKSEALYGRAKKTIPLAAQTFSKSITQFPYGAAPLFASHAKGAHLWDVDGNEYIDFINGLASITLGYADPDVNAAVVAQLQQGTIFSLSHELESRVAERIVAMVPSAEMVRFGKNGSDATSGAIRVARAATGRDVVLVAGYHGWQDWYIGSTTRNKGVPKATQALTHKFVYNDVDSLASKLAELEGTVAAIILEPMNVEYPKPGYLQAVRDLATKAGAVLIFDETITGFRYARGGAQEEFGVTPDLTTLGKGLANGFPLAAVCGRADLMKEMEEIFFSFTMGGETISLAAADVVLSKIDREPVLATMRQRGATLLEGLTERVARHGASKFMRTSGHPCWSFLNISDCDGISSFEIKTLWMQEMFARGILAFGSHNISYAHSEADIARTLAVYDEVLPLLVKAIANRSVRQLLKCEPLVPLFKVR